MRVPLILSLPLSLLTIGTIWWLGTKSYDFLTPPAETTLAEIRTQFNEELKATGSIAPEEPRKAIKVKPTRLAVPDPDVEVPVAPSPDPNALDLGDVKVSPALDALMPLAARGSDVLIEAATQLELRGETQYALLAWERVLDASTPLPEQLEFARKAMLRLRPQLPQWNVDPLTTHQVTWHVQCDREHAATLEPILKEILHLLNDASSGLMDCQLALKAGAPPRADAPRQPIALWFSGAKTGTGSTKTASLPLTTTVPQEQKNLLIKCLYQLIRDSLANQPGLQPLLELPSQEDPAQWLQSTITRRAWERWISQLCEKKS